MGAKTEDLEIAYKVDVDYPLALLNAIEKTSLAQRQTKFRFVYLSGLMAETDPEKALWYMPVRRRVKVT